MRILEVGNHSLLGMTHTEAVRVLRATGDTLVMLVCDGFDPRNVAGMEVNVGLKLRPRTQERDAEDSAVFFPLSVVHPGISRRHRKPVCCWNCSKEQHGEHLLNRPRSEPRRDGHHAEGEPFVHQAVEPCLGEVRGRNEKEPCCYFLPKEVEMVRETSQWEREEMEKVVSELTNAGPSQTCHRGHGFRRTAVAFPNS